MLLGGLSGSIRAAMKKKRGRSSRRPTDRDLQAYVDGELDPARRAEVKSALRKDPALRATVHHYETQKRATHRLYDPVLSEPLSESLTKLLRKRLAKPR